MSLSIQCPSCGVRYEVSDATHGKRVRCKKCQHVFAAVGATPLAAPLTPLGASTPPGPLAGVDLSQFPAASLPQFSQLPPQPAWSSGGGPAAPLEGPSDLQMRLLSAAMIGLGLVMAIGSAVLHANTGTIYLAAVGLIPLTLVLGIAGLISPNVVRACGKYGGHLPWQYKAAGWGLIGLSFVLMILLMLVLFSAGFKPG